MDWSLEHLMKEFDLEPTPMDRELALKHSTHPSKPGRIVSLTFNSSLIRKVRLTYFDAGSAVQVFNMVVYPDPSIDAPILGVDLIAFNKKHLAGIDFQPLYNDPIYLDKYTKSLASIKSRYSELNQKMSSRFYDSAQFFSDNMLFSRFEDTSIIHDQLFPAFSEYLELYIRTLKHAQRVNHQSFRSSVLDRHRAYDQYNAERDPAHGLFVQYFGNEWSEKFIDEFLFELSVRPEKKNLEP
jgi:15,16-dihydrobiliverdin:ferredoxin oxidoreductase